MVNTKFPATGQYGFEKVHSADDRCIGLLRRSSVQTGSAVLVNRKFTANKTNAILDKMSGAQIRKI